MSSPRMPKRPMPAFTFKPIKSPHSSDSRESAKLAGGVPKGGHGKPLRFCKSHSGRGRTNPALVMFLLKEFLAGAFQLGAFGVGQAGESRFCDFVEEGVHLGVGFLDDGTNGRAARRNG